MEDNEIIKAFRLCHRQNGTIPCFECPYYSVDTDKCLGDNNTDILDLINRQKAEIERLNKQLGELKFLESRVKSIKNTPKNTFSGALISIAEGVARYETIKEFEERAIKNICEKVYAPTPVQSCIVEKCNQVIVETAKEVVGEG